MRALFFLVVIYLIGYRGTGIVLDLLFGKKK
jgi:hypothetical protein